MEISYANEFSSSPPFSYMQHLKSDVVADLTLEIWSYVRLKGSNNSRGVPQGSCFGKVLFTLYTPDLLDCVTHCAAHAYADDLRLHLSFCQCALGRLSGLYRFRSLLPQAAELQRINTLILSVFHYCYPAYGNSILKEDAAAEKIQKNADHCIAFRSQFKQTRQGCLLIVQQTVYCLWRLCVEH
ncbi:hypothetical protein J6590_062265 [Homalodisca vitripennis]|nr:hypothetical protein J6590_062265 [Homalodisca vitripennis]